MSNDLHRVMAEVARAERTRTPIYDGTARTIAAGYHGGVNTAMTAFASTGTITDDLGPEIDREIGFVTAHPEDFDVDEAIGDRGTASQNLRQLRALADYVNAHGRRSRQPGWDRVWADELRPEDEYNNPE